MAEKPRDDFECYFAEKLWEIIPAVYRYEDGLGENRGVLRAFVEVLAEQAALLRRSHDRLWEDQFIELCDDWAVPYIGDLVGTRLVSALNPAGRRVDVAKTIYYRRRKGTLRVLEELISDIARWEGVAAENIRRLARTQHGLDPEPTYHKGPFSGAMPGGWADLRCPRITEMVGSPYDEFHHTADIRRHRGFDGRYGIPKIAFHLYRLSAFKVEGVTPHKRPGGKTFTFDPSGRDVPLFTPRNRPENWNEWRATCEWDLPSALRCRLLAHAEYEITESLVKDLVDNHGLSAAVAAELRTFCKKRFRSESRLREFLGTLAHSADFLSDNIYSPILRGAIIDDCGKKALLPRALEVKVGTPGTGVATERIVAGNLDGWSAVAPGKKVVVDPERGRLLFLDAPGGKVTVSYHYGFSGEIGAGPYDRRDFLRSSPDVSHTRKGGGSLTANDLMNEGVTQLNDSATYGPVSDKLAVKNLTLQAANGERPYLRLLSDWVLSTGSNNDSELLLEGVWIGSRGRESVILRGDYETVIIRHSTIDPGGHSTLDPHDEDPKRNGISSVPLVIEGYVEQLLVLASIMGPIRTQGDGIIEKLIIRDSILQSIDPATPALSLSGGEVEMKRVTVFGGMKVHRLWASESLITGDVEVKDTQTGCFRFSAAPAECFNSESDEIRLPRPYESHPIKDSSHYFTSRRFGNPGYAQLSETAPEELRRGAESGSEIGAFSGPPWNGSVLPEDDDEDENEYEKMLRNYERMVRIVGNTILFDSLRAKVDEYLPFGLIPIFIQET